MQVQQGTTFFSCKSAMHIITSIVPFQVVQGDSVTGATFQQFVQEAVVYMLAVARTHNALISTPQAKFWKAMMAKAYEVIDKVG